MTATINSGTGDRLWRSLVIATPYLWSHLNMNRTELMAIRITRWKVTNDE